MKKAIIVGHTGQDGSYLSELLSGKGYEVLGISSTLVTKNNYGIQFVDVLQTTQVESVIKKVQPDEVYFLAAVHQSSADKPVEDGELFYKSFDLNIKAPVNFLESIRKFSSQTKFFYAASSHVFGSPISSPQNEETLFNPDCIYGITKTAGIRCCRFYKDNHGIFASVGIFYNHESPLRQSKYVSKKIVETAVAIKKNMATELVLGSLESQIDWGYAPDYMQAVYEIVQLPEADNFIISSGELHTIQAFAEEVFSYIGLSLEKYIKINPLLITKKQKQNLFGNNQKIKKLTGWSPSVSFKGLIKILVDEELKK
jgi:GDPmannose 4,6-dehydratase